MWAQIEKPDSQRATFSASEQWGPKTMQMICWTVRGGRLASADVATANVHAAKMMAIHRIQLS